ncbi:MAG: D-aminoacyl-tRNA deacylase [Candidatus Omnitrophota bacterium]
MRVVVQRVKEASVSVDGKVKNSIGKGLLLLVGVSKIDRPEDADRMAQKIRKLRVFEDKQGKMNLDLVQTGGEVLSVPQFTLLADTKKGNRPGFDNAADPSEAKALWERFNEALRREQATVKEGEFGAHMEINLVNDGPVTFVLDSSAGGEK